MSHQLRVISLAELGCTRFRNFPQHKQYKNNGTRPLNVVGRMEPPAPPNPDHHNNQPAD